MSDSYSLSTKIFIFLIYCVCINISHQVCCRYIKILGVFYIQVYLGINLCNYVYRLTSECSYTSKSIYQLFFSSNTFFQIQWFHRFQPYNTCILYFILRNDNIFVYYFVWPIILSWSISAHAMDIYCIFSYEIEWGRLKDNIVHHCYLYE